MNYSKYILKIFLSITFILLLTKCYFNPSGGSIEYFKKELKVKNPTVYIFNKSLNKVKSAIEKSFSFYGAECAGKYYQGGEKLLQKNNTYLHPEIFEDTLNYNDYIFQARQLNRKSQIYFSIEDTIPLIYSAEFHLHLVTIDSNRTLVQVITYDPYIITGEPVIKLVGEFGRNEYFVSVEPSSIEEYEILLRIGKTLGVKEKMPPLLLPK
jgi:hypothetical protein